MPPRNREAEQVITSSSDFVALPDRARDGDRDSLSELARKYEPEVRIVARVLLGPSLRPYVDSIDLVQSVHKSLLLGLRQAKYRIGSPEPLVALAVTVLRRKVARKWGQNRRQQRPRMPDDSDENLVDVLSGLAGTEPDPARHAQMTDAVRRLWNQLSALDPRVIELRLEGHSTADAARLLGDDPDRLRVRLNRLRRQVRESGLFDDRL
jgi:RNA polymerase sigma factor (sigma-70 family)